MVGVKKFFLILLYVLLLCFPLITIVNSLGGKTFLQSFSDFDSAAYFFLRFFALYAIIFLFLQVLLGTFMNQLRRIFGPKMLQFHIIQGITAYFVILLHPVMYFIFQTSTQGLAKSFFDLPPNFNGYFNILISLGKIALILLTISVLAGLLRKIPALIPHWRKLHQLNYIVFAIVIYHSWNIGQDTQEKPFVYLYPVFILGLVAGIVNKIWRYLMTFKPR